MKKMLIGKVLATNLARLMAERPDLNTQIKVGAFCHQSCKVCSQHFANQHFFHIYILPFMASLMRLDIKVFYGYNVPVENPHINTVQKLTNYFNPHESPPPFSPACRSGAGIGKGI